MMVELRSPGGWVQAAPFSTLRAKALAHFAASQTAVSPSSAFQASRTMRDECVRDDRFMENRPARPIDRR
jgi:hypothetical protein